MDLRRTFRLEIVIGGTSPPEYIDRNNRGPDSPKRLNYIAPEAGANRVTSMGIMKRNDYTLPEAVPLTRLRCSSFFKESHRRNYPQTLRFNPEKSPKGRRRLNNVN
ncbi:hypothetical protein Zmor_012957 [Zophobas morio]|uniref:Uncharacterized protein n=1 Tax=Zophobas morio TaxID=2755281 RepID=A0AA38ME69_9CUCU|nr:hypothetical protein Zmor_012957 [Zophobas morio]